MTDHMQKTTPTLAIKRTPLRYSVLLNGLCILPHCWVILIVGKGWCRVGFLRKRYPGQSGKDCLWGRMVGV